MTRQTLASPVPFLRWAGSKRWLVPWLERLLPTTFNSYFEPFLGSGAVFFRYATGHDAYLSDTLTPLMEAYAAVRDSPDQVLRIARRWPTDVETYYKVRSGNPKPGTAHAAARFIYLNKLCFNGLYRENGAGRFNVPYGRPRATNTVVDAAHLNSCSQRLKLAVDLSACDFEEALSRCKTNDLVYLDPPYVAGHKSNGFVDYNAKIFNWEDQERLAAAFRRLDRQGVYVIQTNADHPTLREIYRDYASLTVSRHSSMSGRAQSRGKSNELVILSARLAEERLG